ncbi:MAG: formate dehydrogenase subunit gamma [Betaproteobacteria bacterium]
MARIAAPVRAFIVALLAVLFIFAIPALAQSPDAGSIRTDRSAEEIQRQKDQPGNNAPVWREVRSGQEQTTSIPGRETNILVQTEGQMWRAKRNGFWSIISGWALVGLVGLLALAHWYFGPNYLHEPETGRKVLRFTPWQRGVHWSTAISFSVLAISGLIMLFGKNVLLPLIGYTLFSWLAVIAKNLHNFVGPLFLISILVLAVTFVRDNIPTASDMAWLTRLGGLIGKSKGEPPSGKFNAGEKLWFWGGAITLGLIVGITGLILDFPNFDQTRSTMQTSNIIHLISTTLLMLGGLGHIYLGTLSTPGAYEGMKTGLVDETWAKEHHRDWYNDIKSGKINADPNKPAVGSRHPASGPAD